VLAADPDMVLEACIFEIVGQRVSQIPIPDWVFTAFGQPVTNRNFIYQNMIYPTNMRRSMGGGQVPDESQLETRMCFIIRRFPTSSSAARRSTSAKWRS